MQKTTFRLCGILHRYPEEEQRVAFKAFSNRSGTEVGN